MGLETFGRHDDTDTLPMNESVEMKGMWREFTGKAKEYFADLTDNDLEKFEGKFDQAVGYIQKKYGENAREFQEWWGERSAQERAAAEAA